MLGISLTAPTSVELTLTKACNHKCLHCYNPWREQADCKTSGFTKEQLDIIARELKENDVWHVTLSGGEPLMRPDVLINAAKALKEAGITFSMNTNLTLMTEELAKTLKEDLEWSTLILTSLPSIQPELCDTITQIPGSYERILKGIAICKDYGFKVGINIVISQKNKEDLNNIKEFIAKNRIDYLCISIVIPPAYDSENPDYYLRNEDICNLAESLMEIKRKYGIDVDSITPLPICILKDVNKYMEIISTTCSAGLTRCTIDTDGNIFACSHEESPYGNIFTDGLKSAWDKMDNWRAGEKLNPECKECKYLAICGGECRMMKNEDNLYYKLDKNADIQYNPTEPDSTIYLFTSFKVNRNVKIRKESFGAAIRINYSEYFITEEILQLYNLLCDLGEFKVGDLLDYVDESDSLTEIITYLEDINMITRN